jgi:hypothetical protein
MGTDKEIMVKMADCNRYAMLFEVIQLGFLFVQLLVTTDVIMESNVSYVIYISIII